MLQYLINSIFPQKASRPSMPLRKDACKFENILPTIMTKPSPINPIKDLSSPVPRMGGRVFSMGQLYRDLYAGNDSEKQH